MSNSWRALAKMARDRIVASDPEDLGRILDVSATLCPRVRHLWLNRRCQALVPSSLLARPPPSDKPSLCRMHQLVRGPQRRSPHVCSRYVPRIGFLASVHTPSFFPRSRGTLTPFSIRLEWARPTPRDALAKADHAPVLVRRPCDGTATRRQRALAPVRTDGVPCARALLVRRSVGVCRCAQSDFRQVQAEGEGGGAGYRAAEGTQGGG
jgi:hypothetical protein